MSEPRKLMDAGGTVTAKCADCGAQHEVAQVAWDMAMMFHKQLLARGEKGMPGVGRCERCSEEFEAEQHRLSMDRYFRDVQIFKRMRAGLARVEQGRATRQDIARFIESLPGDFMAEHNHAVKSFRSQADERFAKRDKQHGVDDDDFGL